MITDPYSVVADRLEQILSAEFSAEGFPVRHDRLHESIGHNGTVIGISPESEIPVEGQRVTQAMEVLVQFYGKYDLEIDPEQRVDPRRITQFAERFRRAVNADDFAGNDYVWYFMVAAVRYPKDATGNKTRFEAIVRAYGSNAGLVETIG